MSEPSGTYFDGPHGRQHMERVLIVEGADDAYFFDVILRDVGASPARTGILYLTGKDQLQNELGPFLKSTPFKHGAVNTYGIVKDADAKATAAITEAHRILRSHGEPEPAAGTFAAAPAGRAGRVGLLILPTAGDTGDLEEVCLRTVADEALTKESTHFLPRPSPRAARSISFQSERPRRTSQINTGTFVEAPAEDSFAAISMETTRTLRRSKTSVAN